MKRNEWRDSGSERERFPATIGRCAGEEYEGDTCPGWVTRQPAISDACQSHFWAEKGQLSIVFPGGVPHIVVEAVETLTRAYNLHQSEKLKTP
jgi:hypothetical protein